MSASLRLSPLFSLPQAWAPISAEFERSPLNTSRRGSMPRRMSPKEAAETVPPSKLAEALERVAGETLAFRQDNTNRKTDDSVFEALDADLAAGEHDPLRLFKRVIRRPRNQHILRVIDGGRFERTGEGLQ